MSIDEFAEKILKMFTPFFLIGNVVKVMFEDRKK